jgi:hypothetical protein
MRFLISSIRRYTARALPVHVVHAIHLVQPQNSITRLPNYQFVLTLLHVADGTDKFRVVHKTTKCI